MKHILGHLAKRMFLTLCLDRNAVTCQYNRRTPYAEGLSFLCYMCSWVVPAGNSPTAAHSRSSARVFPMSLVPPRYIPDTSRRATDCWRDRRVRDTPEKRRDPRCDDVTASVWARAGDEWRTRPPRARARDWFTLVEV